VISGALFAVTPGTITIRPGGPDPGCRPETRCRSVACSKATMARSWLADGQQTSSCSSHVSPDASRPRRAQRRSSTQAQPELRAHAAQAAHPHDPEPEQVLHRRRRQFLRG
jgi:hypothetical protein